MSEKIDVCGLSCPQPVIKTRKKILEMKSGILEVLVDTGTSRDNVSRMAEKEGWKVEVAEKDDQFILTLTT